MKYTYKDAPRNVVLWACAYSTNNTEKSMSLKKLPIQGIIVDNGERDYRQLFYEINKKGEKKSTSVYAPSRQYADSYEESVEIYNDLVCQQINFLNGLIADCESDKIIR